MNVTKYGMAWYLGVFKAALTVQTILYHVNSIVFINYNWHTDWLFVMHAHDLISRKELNLYALLCLNK